MQRRALGNSRLTVPVVGMGTWRTFDVEGPARGARRRLTREAIEQGVSLFDTSPMYGEAPEVLAAALRNRRDDALVADKVWASSLEEGERQLNHSLALFEGRVDIMQVHNLREWRIHLPHLEAARERGEVRVIGVTHYNPNHFDDVEAIMRSGAIEMVQIPYNIMHRQVEDQLLPLAERLGLGVLVMEPLGTGSIVHNAPSADALSPYLDKNLRTWAQVCLKWVLSDFRVSSVLVATSSSAHLADNARAGEGPWYDERERAALASLF